MCRRRAQSAQPRVVLLRSGSKSKRNFTEFQRNFIQLDQRGLSPRMVENLEQWQSASRLSLAETAATGRKPQQDPGRRPRKCTFESAAARARPARGTTSLRVGRPALAIAESPSRYRVTPVPATRVSESRRCHGGCCMSPSSWNNQFNASEPKPANKNQPP